MGSEFIFGIIYALEREGVVSFGGFQACFKKLGFRASEANVKIWINGKAADESYAVLGIAGFQSNPLELGKDYSFDAKVQFLNGNVVERKLTVRSGLPAEFRIENSK